MASRKQKKGKAETAAASTSTEVKDPSAEKSAAPASETRKKATKRTGGRRTATTKHRRPGRPKGSKNKPRVAAAKPAGKGVTKKSTRSRRYTPAERAKILAAAEREGLSGPVAAKKFGISQLTFYTWRKKSGSPRRGRPKGRAAATGAVVGRTVAGALNIADAIRQELRTQIRRILPQVIASELGSIMGGARRGRRRGSE